jgi:hypothetical protein
MKLLPLANGIDYAIVDDEDFERLSNFIWGKNKTSIFRQTMVDVSPFYHEKVKVAIPLANEVMQKFNCIFDHKDIDFKNNQKLNLREATYSQNNHNHRKRRGYYSSKYKGVSFRASDKKWISSITKNGYKYYIGYFESEVDAAIAYNNKAIELYGNFANINVI